MAYASLAEALPVVDIISCTDYFPAPHIKQPLLCSYKDFVMHSLSYLTVKKQKKKITCIKPQNPNIKLGAKETTTTKVQHSCGCGSKEEETNTFFSVLFDL